MRPLTAIFGLFVLLVGMTGVEASTPQPEFRMAVVDFQKALNSVEEGKRAMKAIEEEGKKKEASLKKRQEELEKLQTQLEEFQRNASTGMMSPDAMEKGRRVQEEFRQKYEAYTRELQEAEQTMQRKEIEARRGIIGRLRDVVNDMGRSGTYTLIVEANESGLLYASSYTDLTERVIQEYNKKHEQQTGRRGRR